MQVAGRKKEELREPLPESFHFLREEPGNIVQKEGTKMENRTYGDYWMFEKVKMKPTMLI